jgi:ketosteroid isomerase-like protein
MSQENVEIVRRANELWSEGNLDAWAKHWDPEVVVMAPEGWPEGKVSRGLDAWRRQTERLRDSWDDARVEIDDISPVGRDRVVTRFRYVTRGKDPGMTFDTPMAAMFVLREGVITRAEYFWELADALEAAGLSE